YLIRLGPLGYPWSGQKLGHFLLLRCGPLSFSSSSPVRSIRDADRQPRRHHTIVRRSKRPAPERCGQALYFPNGAGLERKLNQMERWPNSWRAAGAENAGQARKHALQLDSPPFLTKHFPWSAKTILPPKCI